MDSAVVLFALAALGHFPLHHFEHFRVDDGLVVILDIVLWDFALVDLGLLGQEIDGVAFLKERIAFVKPMFERVRTLWLENDELTKLRDWLLPMLMNGQATVE